jgi:DNA modification methylase
MIVNESNKRIHQMNTPMRLLIGDCIESMKGLESGSVNTCVTSPPYFGLRDYGHEGQIGLEPTPEAFVAKLVEVFREVKRVLRDDGTVFLNLGDSYANNTPGLKPKDLIGIPWRVAFALQADGWYLRQDIIWHKPNPMPESVRDRCTKAHEYIFLLSKSARYYYDHEAVREGTSESSCYGGTYAKRKKGFNEQGNMGKPGMTIKEPIDGKRNKRSVWKVTTKPYKGAHFATFPPDLIEPCILAGCPEGGTVLDPFGGSGTTAGVAIGHGRNAILCELSPEYSELIPERIKKVSEAIKAKTSQIEMEL